MNDTQPDGNTNVFLATTALEEFWDTSKHIVFLGEWCLLYSRRSFWKSLNNQLLGSPFDDSETAHAAYHYVNGIYERILPLIGDVLNTIHGTCYSQRYWRIIIGPWLLFYLPVIYDRYSHLRYALDQYPDCTTIVLSESSFITPSDALDFVSLVNDDTFNLQVYTKLLATLGKNFPCKVVQMAQNPLHRKDTGVSWKRKALGYLAGIYARSCAKASQSIFFRSSYFSRASEFHLLIRNIGKIFPILPPLFEQSWPPCNNDIRKNLPKIEIGHSEFEQCLSAILFSDMPRCFVEGFCHINRKAQNIYPKIPKAIFSSNGWYLEEVFKHWAAISAENGTLLMGTPHGGSYGGEANMLDENHETAIVDRYYSWGWERTDCVAEVIPFPATKLVGRKKIGASNRETGILWVTTSMARYLRLFPHVPKYFCEYLSWQPRFAETLSEEIMASIRVRPHFADYGWDIIQRLEECIPGVSIETRNVPFQESLVNCRLYVCDHFSTTFAEALAANKPTVLFWNPRTNKLRPDAQPYYDLLRKNGILFDTPECAGAAVNQIYDDVETWWNDPERQNAVKIFCERFARNSPDAIELWVAEFKRIAAMPSLKVIRTD